MSAARPTESGGGVVEGSTPTQRDPGWEQVARALQGIRFGEVRVIIQDGLIVQIERTEKQRLR